MSTLNNDVIDRVKELGFEPASSFHAYWNLKVPGTIWVVNDTEDKFCFCDRKTKMKTLTKEGLWPS